MRMEINPWLRMWTQPRQTVRKLLHSQNRYGVLFLSALYALQALLFFFYYWSLGLSFSSYSLASVALLLAPLGGVVWVYLSGWIYGFTGKWLKGTASSSPLRTALAWSKLPLCLNLLLWGVFLLSYQDSTFILDGGGPSSVLINLLSLSLGVWSLILLIQSLREIQSFSALRALFNILMARLISFFLFFILFSFARLLYILMS